LKEVLHILATAQPAGTGIARLVVELARRSDRERYHFSAWFLLEDGPLVTMLRSEGVDARVVRWRPSPRDPLGAIRFWRALHGGYDIIHQHFGGPWVRRLARRASPAKILLHLHGRVNESAQPVRVRLDCSLADKVIAVSRAVAECTSVPAEVVYSGVALETVASFSKGRPSEELLIGTASRLISLKRIDDILQAFASLTHQYPSTKLEIAGDGPERAHIEAEIERLGLAARVRMLGWRSDVGAVMRGWDVYVQASAEEAFPLAVLEAMSAALPVVVTRVGGLPELVTHNETGVIVPPGNHQALADALGRLLGNPAERHRLGLQAETKVRESFSGQQFASKISAIYDGLTFAGAQELSSPHGNGKAIML
jgi:glycosyltransferase involved in cell wall biosynthesis